ncbi:MAG: succinate dehydrogenase cytochrome b subunit [Proteobacteria bacterium]|jgi:succinate dehydrogenase / fumarate reductase cytochrome b subunit|nr:succinate dehydrogenase cytochrome b subunit [Pseudomonadota bacterium]
MAVASARSFLLTSIGKKYLMGLTGLIWAGFVFAHMAGNMLIFVGADAYNKYGHFLTSGYFIYVAEAVLVLSLLVHVGCAISLTIENRAARPTRYAVTPNGSKGVTLASMTMAFHGSIILVFIITHLITFKFGTYYETTVDGVVMRDLHRLMIEVFQNPTYVFWYVISLVLLGFHLSHGVGSIFQSLGLRNDRTAPTIQKASCLYGVVVAAGFLSQPIYVFFFAG